MAAGQSHVFGLPAVDPPAAVSVGHQHVQAWLALGQHTLVTLAQLSQRFLVIRGDDGHPRQWVGKGLLQTPVVDQFTAH